MTNELYTTFMSLGVIAMASMCYWLNVLASDRWRLGWTGRALNTLGAVICVALAIVDMYWRG